MDILVVSDTHGRRERLAEVMTRTHAGIVLFLGDGLRDLTVIPDGVTVRAVRGNCDFVGRDIPETCIEHFGTYRVFMTHGHRYGVKAGIGAAVAAAVDADADVLLYGHTHRPEDTTLPAGAQVGERVLKKPLLILCPGSLGDPRDGVPSFGTLTIRNNGVLAGLGKL
ncbi:MAG: metallophosphoesterase family protein [Clostridia bacterium]|nr:metallophosphoesterase family protein [Clostridia bacterium]